MWTRLRGMFVFNDTSMCARSEHSSERVFIFPGTAHTTSTCLHSFCFSMPFNIVYIFVLLVWLEQSFYFLFLKRNIIWCMYFSIIRTHIYIFVNIMVMLFISKNYVGREKVGGTWELFMKNGTADKMFTIRTD